MTRRPPVALATLLLGLLSIAAGPPVALRVELEPTGADGDRTTMSVTIQVAPEDRARVGRDVWVQGELLAHGERVDRLARALDLDERGQARFEVAWLPGEYELRVEIRGAKRDGTGAWAGRVTIPSPGSAPSSAEPEPSEAATPEPLAAGVAAGAVTPDERAEPAPASTDSAAAADSTADEPPDGGSPEPSRTKATAAVVAAGSAAAVSMTASDESEKTSVAGESQATAEPLAEAVAETPEPSAESPSEPSPAETAPAEVILEPATAAVPTIAEPVSGEPVAASAWAAEGDATADVTVVVTEQNRPILGLNASAFTLRVGRTEAPLHVIGDASTAPLNLGLVICLAAGSDDLAAEVARQLGGFSLRTRSGGNLFVVTPSRPRPDWGATADDIARTVGAGEGGPSDLARLVADAAEAFEGRRGRSFLVVVTDGGDDSGKAAWKETVTAAEGAGVPIYVVGLRDSGFDDRARSSLAKLAVSTGGRSYFLGDAGMAGMTLDYLGQLIDGSYALPFRSPGGPAEIKVEIANGDWDVAFPRRVP